MNLTIFISLLFGLQFFYWAVGKRASKNVRSQEDYLLAGKSVRLFPLTMTFLATQVGGGLVLGAAEEAYRFGWVVLLYPLGASLGLIALGLGIGKKLASFPVATVAQLLGLVYRSDKLKTYASLLSIISLFMILVAQVIASAKFLAGIGLTSPPLFILFWAIVILYTVQGGLKAVISTDIAQASFFSAIFLLCFGVALFSHPAQSGMAVPLEAVSSKLSGWLLMPLLFMVIEQDMAQRCFAGASSRTVSKASLFAGVGTMILCFVPVFFGVLAKTKGILAPSGTSVLMAAVANTTSPAIAAALGCAVLAAIISTATSLISAISSNLAGDFTMSKGVRSVRAITAGISIAAIFFAFYFDNIVDLLIQSYDLSVSSLFVPVIFALFKKENHFISALLAIVCGAAGFFLFKIVPIAFPGELASVALSFAGFALGETIAKKRTSQLRNSPPQKNR